MFFDIKDLPENISPPIKMALEKLKKISVFHEDNRG